VNAKTKHFIGFFSSIKNEPYRVMHNQQSIAGIAIPGQTTLAKIFHNYRDLFLPDVHT
jgi:hypothetical protein